MWPDWVSNPGPLTYESGALPIALHGPAPIEKEDKMEKAASQAAFSIFGTVKGHLIYRYITL